MRFLSIFLLFISNLTLAQNLNKADQKIIQSLQSNIGFLSSDNLEGRRAGTYGEQLAAEFIAEKFKESNLIPKGTDNYFQAFSINDGKEFTTESFFTINGKKLLPIVEFFPLSNSKNGILSNVQISPLLNENSLPRFIDLSDILSENKDNPHFDLANNIHQLVLTAKEKGSTAVILFNTGSINDKLYFDAKDRSEPEPIPVIYLTKESQKNYIKDLSHTYDFSFNITIGQKTRNAKNIIGFINNNAKLTVVLGAHYDHLGYGEDGNSMLRTGEHIIHNGADDNASGTGALIELSKLLSKKANKKYNYLFIAFSAEELGLNGSKFFVEHPTIDLSTINYMFNMDMVGRMNDSSKTITIGGFGTSPVWKSRLDNAVNENIQYKPDSSGSGPSDHTSFYRKDIPVLFFFSGLHTDYHKPSDDAEKINYIGEYKIIKLIEKLIKDDVSAEKIPFLKTREQQTSTSTRFSVSMGIMPDYSYPGNGVRVDGVSENKPAKKAGILAGDIIKQLGDHKTSSVESYMQALAKFKKGDATTVRVLRNNSEITLEIIF